MPHSDALDARIREKAAKLAEFHPNITSCRVTVDETAKHHRQGWHFNVSIDVRVPGKEIVVHKGNQEDVYVALRDAFEATKRQVDEYLKVKRGFVKTHAAEPQGEAE
jgi:ribosomal subunit interface protein